ncbi:hypothetical protein H4R21_002438 [Coemansia helicoidea]|uniref:Uncharacterized protein n=1 Tax=Coemansia helicoidea TaxID=1286919 RepID=A0ACC1L7H6_9FUNG|nr:hypothetical protein H4R21_002438 [Coemansia helicoidea]
MRKAENPTTSESNMQDPPPSCQAPASSSDKDHAPSSDKAPPPVDSGAQNLVEPPTDRDAHPRQQSVDQTVRLQQHPVDQAVRLQQHPVGVLAPLRLGLHPMAIKCPRCHAEVTTKVKKRFGMTVLLRVAVVSFFAPPLFWLPLVMSSTRHTVHHCPQCKRKIGHGHR